MKNLSVMLQSINVISKVIMNKVFKSIDALLVFKAKNEEKICSFYHVRYLSNK
jgi:hypothetical protein